MHARAMATVELRNEEHVRRRNKPSAIPNKIRKPKHHVEISGDESDILASDDLAELTANLSEPIVDDKRLQKKRKNMIPQCIHTHKHVIKVMDKESQTDDDDNIKYYALQNEYDSLQTKYEQLKDTLKEFQADIKSALVKVDSDSRLESKPSSMHRSRKRSSSNAGKHASVKSHSARSDTSQNSDSINMSTSSGRKVLTKLHDAENKEDNKNEGGDAGDMVHIGSGKTKVQRNIFESINWYNYSTATRKLLMCLFPRNTLATHSLTGKPSPAFIASDKQAKMRLDPVIIADIVETVSRKCGISESLVRSAITTKCADENKMYRKRLEKRGKENAEVDDAAKKTKLN